MAIWSDIATWQGPTANEGDGDGRPGEPEDRMSGHVGLVIHIAEGTYDGTQAWERNPVAQVSSHFVVAKDGRIAQMVDTDDRSWCQSAGNATWISVENEGFHTQAPTAAQVEANARIYAKCMRVYGAPAQLTDSPSVGGLGWHGMGGNAWGGHFDCPGDQFKAARPAILARAVQIVSGTTGGGDELSQQASDSIIWEIRPWLIHMFNVVDAIAAKVDITPDELAQIKASANAGALQALASSADAFAAKVVAALPAGTGGLTAADVETAVKAALRTGTGT